MLKASYKGEKKRYWSREWEFLFTCDGTHHETEQGEKVEILFGLRIF